MLFYMRMQGDVLGAAINLHGANDTKKGMKRKSPEDDNEDRGVVINGTAAPSSSPVQLLKTSLSKPTPSSPRPDPQALKLQERIAKAKAEHGNPSRSNVSLVPYSSDGEDEDGGETRKVTPAPEKSSPPSLPPSSSSVPPVARSSSPIEPASFYGDSQSKKRKSAGASDDDTDHGTGETKRRRPSSPSDNRRYERQQLPKLAGTPFTSSSMSNNLHEVRGGPSQEQNNYQPHQKQHIVTMGRPIFRPKGKRFAAGMKPRKTII